MTKYDECAETRRNTHTHTGSLCLAFILSILTFPTFSETLGNSPQCDNATLHTTTGPATLNARWTANTIILNWDAGNDATFTAPAQNDAAYSCEYDGGITLPTAPTRSGYTFGGWRVAQSQQQQQCSLSGVWTSGMANESINLDYEHVRWKQMGNNGSTMTDFFGEENSSDLNPGEWAVRFTSGELKGRALCSSTNGTAGQLGAPDETGGGRYCWAAGTSFNNQCSVTSPLWLSFGHFDDAGDCTENCVLAALDLFFVDETSQFRSLMFGVTE